MVDSVRWWCLFFYGHHRIHPFMEEVVGKAVFCRSFPVLVDSLFKFVHDRIIAGTEGCSLLIFCLSDDLV